MVIKRSPGGQACRWRAINFEIHLWSSGKNADCIFGDRSASSMSKWRPAWTLTPEMIHFRTKSVTLSMLIDLLIIVHVDRRRWRAHQLTYDLKRCLLFRKCLRFFESESSFGAYVCHRRPGGSMATSDLVSVLFHVTRLTCLFTAKHFWTELNRKSHIFVRYVISHFRTFEKGTKFNTVWELNFCWLRGTRISKSFCFEALERTKTSSYGPVSSRM